MRILVLNSGSTSVKAALFDGDDAVARVTADGIGGDARVAGGRADLPDHAAAIDAILARLGTDGLDAAAHRVVHGGPNLTRPQLVDAGLRAAIDAAATLAPLHNPANLAGIDALSDLLPDLPQVAVFDTAFHADQPWNAVTYAVPETWRTAGIRRYGFHGISYEGLVAALDPLPRRLVACHLGGGASLCAILDGRSVASTMGYSPLSGLPMATRAGDIDAVAVLRIARADGIDATEEALNRDSGLAALAGTGDMRALRAQKAEAAIGYYIYWIVRRAGEMAAALGGCDAIAFTGGIGENDADLRDRVVDGLSWLGPFEVHVVPADEEATMARAARSVLAT